MGFISSIIRKNKELTPEQQWEQLNKKYADNPIERIREKLALVTSIDHEYKEFGADNHKYQLNSPLSKEKVNQLQAKIGCEFPEDYIAFITQIGNGGTGSYGGAGPYYGLYAFDDAIDRNGIQNCALPCLLSPKMDIDEWKALCHVPEDCSDEDFDTICDRVHQGTLYLGTCGCEYDLLLVVNGDYKGHILYTSDWVNSDTPYTFSYETSFSQWYERWLDEVILGYDTSWFGHRMGGNEEMLLQFAQNNEDITKKISAINSLTKLPELSNNSLDFLGQQLQTEDIELYKVSLNVLATYFKEQALPYIQQALVAPFDEKTDIVIPIIYFKYKDQYALFKESLLPILKVTNNEDTLRFIGYSLTELNAILVEDFQPFFTHPNVEIIRSAIYAASHDINLKDKISAFYELAISENEEISLGAIQALSRSNYINNELLDYLKKAWKMYPEEKNPYIRNNISSYIAKVSPSNNMIDVKQW
ncbi:SMI1/KNR4 family protein [Proteus terrae]|uniref:SMI1/KNR4 family protein n=1 Tax=Proteus terrae TaxID=1574161 RepID=UPI0013E02C97|nr:SMI1/KNR4 family protein [Proteus terrae]MCO4181091.1 SMI1/KNR4 family protein [Proteus terrae]MCO4190359.1 SMI1/KNR4 family protein [Proteus terrae]QIF97718.1 SMI1/KNR4 family protein [Proteus terrae subsp. cibarius]UAX02968.1 SMI1/KNR4 family protein [Proteus terrae subsp. cibarius]UXA35546.1 SMI1/KNR4 family protein [Proteus terrae]